MHSPIAATALLEPIPRQPTPPKAAGRFAAAFRPLLRFPTRRVRQPPAVVALATIKTSTTGEEQDRLGSPKIDAPQCCRQRQSVNGTVAQTHQRRATLEKHHEEAYRCSHDRHADCR